MIFSHFDAGPFAYCKEDTSKGYSTIATFSDLTIYLQRPFRSRPFLNITKTPRYAINPKRSLSQSHSYAHVICHMPNSLIPDSRSSPLLVRRWVSHRRRETRWRCSHPRRTSRRRHTRHAARERHWRSSRRSTVAYGTRRRSRRESGG